MVYGGRPSRGCRTCRARRIKCDEGKPTCRRCAKSNRECGGYRPEFEIVHRDQTRSTVRRLRSVADVVQRQFTSARPLVFVQEQPHTWSRRSSGPAPVLTVPVAERAACNFAANFILMPRSVGPHGFMEYLVPLIEAEPDGSALRHAFNACAFALLGNRARADRLDLAQLSLKEHTLALGQTNKALSHAAVARTDSTLAAVLLLCLYESITAIKETRMLAWRSHIDGAVNLVNARGREQLCRTRMGTLLFSAVRHQLVSRTLSSVVPLPLGADFWMSAGDNESLLATSQRFALRYTELRAESSRLLANSARSPESVEQINDLAARLRNFDCDIASWLRSIPDELRFRTLCWVSQDDLDFSNGRDYGQVEAFPGRVDIYPDFVTTSAWNIGRVSRILVVSLAIRLTAWLCSPVDYRTTPDYETFRRICESLISEIIASVPYQLGWHKKRKEFSGNMPALSGFACGDEGPCKALPCSFLVWPLICVKNHDICSEEQRAWAKGRLQFIADQVGLKYASAVLAVHLRFPSMLIRRDGVMTTPVALQGSSRSDLPPRPAADPAPLTPEKSPSPG